jgi:hypothetical protein
MMIFINFISNRGNPFKNIVTNALDVNLQFYKIYLLIINLYLKVVTIVELIVNYIFKRLNYLIYVI